MKRLTIKEKALEGSMVVNPPRYLIIKSREDKKNGKYIEVKLCHAVGGIVGTFGYDAAYKLHKFLDYFCRK